MSSNADGELITKKTINKRKQHLEEDDNNNNKSLILSHKNTLNSSSLSKNRRKTINVVLTDNHGEEANDKNKISQSNVNNLDEIKKTWKRGTIVEARDLHDNWYKSRIIEADENNRRVKVHFFGWNSRYDQWFDINSSDLRPFKGVQDEEVKTEASSADIQPNMDEVVNFNTGDVILAKWIDNFYYPATVLRVVNKNETVYYEVKFEDGVKKMIRFSNCKHYDRENDLVNVKPAEQVIEEKMIITEPPVPPPAAEPVAPVEEETVNKDDGSVRKSGRVKRPRALSTDEISLFPIRRQSSGISSKKRKINEETSTILKVETLEEVLPKPEPVPPPPPPPPQPQQLIKEKTKKAPLGDYLKSLALFNKNKKRNKETSIGFEAVSVAQEPNDVKLQVNIDNQNKIPSIKLKISKLMSEPNEIKSSLNNETLLSSSIQQQLSAPPIELIRCKFSNCDKTFRKQHLLDYHIKYHHYEDGRIIEVVTKKRKLTQTGDDSLDNSLIVKESKKIKIEDKRNEDEEEEEGDPYEVIHCKCDKTISVGFMIQVLF
jgi:hypothetical protein